MKSTKRRRSGKKRQAESEIMLPLTIAASVALGTIGVAIGGRALYSYFTSDAEPEEEKATESSAADDIPLSKEADDLSIFETLYNTKSKDVICFSENDPLGNKFVDKKRGVLNLRDQSWAESGQEVYDSYRKEAAKKKTNWKAERDAAMFKVVQMKFAGVNPSLRKALMETKDRKLVFVPEKSGDDETLLWGKKGPVGQNHLGNLLMLHRAATAAHILKEGDPMRAPLERIIPNLQERKSYLKALQSDSIRYG